MHFPACAASILCLSIFGHKIGVLKSPTLSKEKTCKLHASTACASADNIRKQSTLKAITCGEKKVGGGGGGGHARPPQLRNDMLGFWPISTTELFS